MSYEALFDAYCDILKTFDTKLLNGRGKSSGRPHNLSGLFLTSVSANYADAKNKIMIVGSETAGWNVLKDGQMLDSLQNYVTSAMDKHKKHFAKQLISKNSRGYSFHNFTRAVSKKCAKDGLIYSNLFCFDWNGGSPIKTPFIDTIKHYSELLLKKQIEILKPGIIIFANGMTSVPYRRKYFPIEGNHRVCMNGRDYSKEGIPNHHLWEFDLYNEIRCFRIHHPSARAKDAVKARKFLIDLLPSS